MPIDPSARTWTFGVNAAALGLVGHYTGAPPSAPAAAIVWLAGHAAPEPFEVALDDGTPLLQASRGQADGESAMEPPGPPLGAGELRDHRSSADLEAIAHAGQQSVELIIAQVNCA